MRAPRPLFFDCWSVQLKVVTAVVPFAAQAVPRYRPGPLNVQDSGGGERTADLAVRAEDLEQPKYGIWVRGSRTVCHGHRLSRRHCGCVPWSWW